MQLTIEQIRTDGNTQPRATVDEGTIHDYAMDMLAGDQFPPVVVFFDGSDYWLAAGFHRVAAARQIGRAEIDVTVKHGTRRDAFLFAVEDNRRNGARYTNADKRAMVERFLLDEEWAAWSDREIARKTGVAHKTVSSHRSSLGIFPSEERQYITKHGSLATMNTANIGARPAIPFIPDEEEPLTPYEEQVMNTYAARWQPNPVTEPTAPLASHQLINASTNNEWYTPRPFLDAAHEVMGGIDLDPASNPLANKTVRATRYFTIHDDGFTQPWQGRVWMNPPYGTHEGESNQARWSRRLIEAYRAGDVSEAIMLVNAVTGNGWFSPLKEFPICFPDGRIRFYNAETEAGQPTHGNALVYLGPNVARFVRVFSQFGAVMARLVEYDGHVYIHGVEDGVSV